MIRAVGYLLLSIALLAPVPCYGQTPVNCNDPDAAHPPTPGRPLRLIPWCPTSITLST